MKRCILIVEDDPDLRLYYRLLLQADFLIIESDSASLALEYALACRPFAILMDLNTRGDVNGVEALRAIRSDPLVSSIPVAIVSSCDEVHVIDEALRCGASSYFVKPVAPNEIVEFIHSSLG